MPITRRKAEKNIGNDATPVAPTTVDFNEIQKRATKLNLTTHQVLQRAVDYLANENLLDKFYNTLVPVIKTDPVEGDTTE